MKQKIKMVLDRHKDGQGNLSSDSFRDMLAVELEANLSLKDNSHTETMVLKKDGQLAKDNPLTIEMWKGYNYEDKPTTWRKEETEDGNRYTPEKNNKQMELEFND
jgi:hypothetical protein|tara:strand:+ start:315 stop:629 length:315 start_codon:yes stop_codon:yes gene_type:complete